MKNKYFKNWIRVYNLKTMAMVVIFCCYCEGYNSYSSMLSLYPAPQIIIEDRILPSCRVILIWHTYMRERKENASKQRLCAWKWRCEKQGCFKYLSLYSLRVKLQTDLHFLLTQCQEITYNLCNSFFSHSEWLQELSLMSLPSQFSSCRVPGRKKQIQNIQFFFIYEKTRERRPKGPGRTIFFSPGNIF